MPRPQVNKTSILYLEELRNEVLKYTASNLALSTHQLYVTAFKNLISFLGNTPIKLITTKRLDDYKSKRAEQVTKSTVNIQLCCIKAVFNLAVKWNMLEVNPAENVKKFRVEQKEILSFRDEELRVLLSEIPDGNLKNIVLFAIYTGCRITEILNIQYKDINLMDRVLYIRNKVETGFRTKSGRNRQIPISDSLFNLLQPLLKSDSNVYSISEPDRYLFTNRKGFKFQKDYISKQFKNHLRACNLPEKFHFHCLRHTFITNLIRNGVNISFVKELAGHSNISTTMNYIHLITDDLRDAVNKIKCIAG
jgi:integrase/recombinase XerD